MSDQPFVSKTCEGEHCPCGKPATHKIAEEIAFDDPTPDRHPLTMYICDKCFNMIFIQKKRAETTEPKKTEELSHIHDWEFRGFTTDAAGVRLKKYECRSCLRVKTATRRDNP
jgi:hypothetical protein